MDMAAPLVIDRPLKDVASYMPPQFLIPLVGLQHICTNCHFLYFVQIKYYDLWDQVARTAINTKLNSMIQTSYKNCHNCSQPGLAPSCRSCSHNCVNGSVLFNKGQIKVLAKLGEGVSSLKNVDATFCLAKPQPNPQSWFFETKHCSHFDGEMDRWRGSVEQAIGEIPRFSSLL
jgi:hypothetical protein